MPWCWQVYIRIIVELFEGQRWWETREVLHIVVAEVMEQAWNKLILNWAPLKIQLSHLTHHHNPWTGLDMKALQVRPTGAGICLLTYKYQTSDVLHLADSRASTICVCNVRSWAIIIKYMPSFLLRTIPSPFTDTDIWNRSPCWPWQMCLPGSIYLRPSGSGWSPREDYSRIFWFHR